jgi:hypothetical protein
MFDLDDGLNSHLSISGGTSMLFIFLAAVFIFALGIALLGGAADNGSSDQG